MRKLINFLTEIFSNRFFPITIFLSTCFLITIGLIFIYSSSSTIGKDYFFKQLTWVSISMMIFAILQFINYKYLFNITPFLYFLSIILLVVVLLFGTRISGSIRWLNFGFVKFQPSEFAKISTVFMLAYYLSSINPPFETFKKISVVLLITFLPVILILQEPDLGTAIIFAFIFVPMLYWRGFKTITIIFIILPAINVICAFYSWSWFVFISIVILLLVIYRFEIKITIGLFAFHFLIGILAPYLWNNYLADYQRQRIIVFLDPYKYKLGSGYQVIQSKVSVGSGGIFGKGIFQGTQKNLNFIPDKHTDFIFSVIAEEIGLVGSSIALFLFFVIFYQSLKIASITKHPFGQMTIIGLVSAIFFQMFFNVGIAIGMLPVTGLPLPFISYGGSSLLMNIVIIAIICNISMRRYEY